MSDSYRKLIENVFGPEWRALDLFANVVPSDREQVAKALADMVARELDNYSDSWRVTPTDLFGSGWEEHEAKRTCCGFEDSSVTCLSGRRYYIGHNFGH